MGHRNLLHSNNILGPLKIKGSKVTTSSETNEPRPFRQLGEWADNGGGLFDSC
jgi:hypothetical protein